MFFDFYTSEWASAIAMAFKITPCSFIIHSNSAAENHSAWFQASASQPLFKKQTDTVLIQPDIYRANDIHCVAACTVGRAAIYSQNLNSMEACTMITAAKFALLSSCLMYAGPMHVLAQGDPEHGHGPHGDQTRIAQVVALDECDPTTFNEAVGPGFCKNVALAALGFATTFQDLLTKAANGTPDPGWDFEPDTLRVKQGTTVVVTNQGGEPHTFTEVKKFGGGFVEGLNGGAETVSECSGGFKNIDVAKTRIIQGSDLRVTDLSKGEHRFQCCLHPWMRMKVEVK